MYTHKNKAFSIMEITISLFIFLTTITIFSTVFFPSIKVLNYIQKDYTREKEILILRELIHNHLNWNESQKTSILQVKDNDKVPSFEKIFSDNSGNNGNLMIIKYNSFKELENGDKEKFVNYRYFYSTKNKIGIGYTNEKDFVSIFGNLKYSYSINECEAYFKLNNNLLKITLKDKKRNKIYEEIIYYEQK